MGKVEDLRAIKDARFAAAQTRSGTSAGAAGGPVRAKAPVRATAPVRAAAPAPDAPVTGATGTPDGALLPLGVELCGHRAISGKTCNREKGHDEKAHRYPRA